MRGTYFKIAEYKKRAMQPTNDYPRPSPSELDDPDYIPREDVDDDSGAGEGAEESAGDDAGVDDGAGVGAGDGDGSDAGEDDGVGSGVGNGAGGDVGEGSGGYGGESITVNRQLAMVRMAEMHARFPPPTSGPAEEADRSCHQCKRINGYPKMRCPGLRLTGTGYPCGLVYCQRCVELRYVPASLDRRAPG